MVPMNTMRYRHTGGRDNLLDGWKNKKELVSQNPVGRIWQEVVDLMSDQEGREVLHHWFSLIVQV